MTNLNQYPVVLLHGMFGFGQQQVTNKVLPYFGLWNTDIRKMFSDMGIQGGKVTPTKEWRKNDMVINTVSAECPDNAPRRDVDFSFDLSTAKPGVPTVNK